MFSTKNQTLTVNEVPSAWVFSYYCNIPIDKLDGSSFKINSMFNPNDKTPSMSLFLSKDIYRFTDFSTGNKGNHVSLVMSLFKLDYTKACLKIINDYTEWVKGGGVYDKNNLVVKDKYKVTDYVIRNWSNTDANFWIPYNINSKLLDRYCVKPLAKYTMTKDDNSFDVSKPNIYGYFTKDGLLYKVYQPYNVESKFIKVQNYIQGSDQTKGNPYLIYLSSLKDILSYESFNLKTDTKAPDSENTLIPEDVIKQDLKTYKKVLVLFDTDDPGIKAANLYHEKYGIEPVFLNYGEKDLSDHVKTHGPQKVIRWLIPLINKKLN